MNRYYRIELCKAWWWKWLYLPAVVVMAAIGVTPNWAKVQSMSARAARVRVVRTNPGVQA